jgi:esterase/lipase superfamily enzyme
LGKLNHASKHPTIFASNVAIAVNQVPSRLAVLVVAVLLAACATRPESGFLSPVAENVTGATNHKLLVATTRERDERPGTLFNGERGKSLHYATLTVSIPPTHIPGKIEWALTPPGNPATNFVVRDEASLDGDKAFVQALNAQLAMHPKGSRKVFMFIHGYNTMFAEGLYRFAQVVNDSKATGVPVLFSWASRGKLAAYVYDNNSATAARDDLAHTLRLILASNADQINILAHSMGNWVTVEALRQIKISGNLQYASKFGDIFLAAPDIDVDVFKSEMRAFGKPRRPFYIVLSKDDKALGFSKFIAGGENRVGADGNIVELEALGATVIDLTDVKGDDPSNHDKFVQLATVAPELRTVLAQGIGANDATADEMASSLPSTLLGGQVRISADQ